MTQHILLVNPWIHDFAAYDLWAKPLGLLSIAAILRRNGAKVTFFDCCAADGVTGGRKPKRKTGGQGHFPKESIENPPPLRHVRRKYYRYGIPPAAAINAWKKIPLPDLIMVTSMMTYWYGGVRESIDLLRHAFPGTPIVLGGVYASLMPDHARRVSGADQVLPGRAESTLAGLMAEFDGNGGDLLRDCPFFTDTVYPAFDMMASRPYIPIMSSRGCPYRCVYCASPYLNGSFHERDSHAVVDEICHWRFTYGVTNIAFYDDALLVHAESRAIPMMEEILRRRLDVIYHCPNGLHAREITPPVAWLMKRCGFQTIRLGLETTDEKRQRATGGKVTNDEICAAITALRRAGYQQNDIGVYILCGLPGQTVSEVENAVRLVLREGGRPSLAEYSPIPHTPLWEDALAVSPFDLENEPLYHNNTLVPCGGTEFTVDRLQVLKSMSRG